MMYPPTELSAAQSMSSALSHPLGANGRHRTLTVWYLLLVLLLTMGPAAAQEQMRGGGQAGLIVVTRDANGDVVAAARVRLTAPAGAVQELVTNSRGEATFTGLAVGVYQLSAEAAGFAPAQLSAVSVKGGSKTVEVRLEVAGVREEITVQQDAQEEKTDPRGNAFTSILTEAQIAELPDDPEEFSEAIRAMAGPDAVIRVNGFSGGRLPPKSQIREIRFRLNPFSAENHDVGSGGVDIYTKPGRDMWHGTFDFGFRDEALGGRNAFAQRRQPEQYRRFGFTLDGPIWRNHTSLFVTAESTPSYDSKTIVAALPEGALSSAVRVPAGRLHFSGRLEHTLTRYHTLRLEYQHNGFNQANLGVGDFDLAERAYSRNQSEDLLRVSDTGPLGHRLVNEFRLQARQRDTRTRSASDLPTIIVLNAFNRGGAQLHSNERANELELTDNVDFALEGHSLRVGGTLWAGRYESAETRNANGTFVFSNLNAFNARRPTTYTKRVGTSALNFTQAQLGWFVQDDFRVRKNFSLSLGVRHEAQSSLNDHNNFAPRLGLAWSPFANAATTIRAGAGVFYQWFGADTLAQTLRFEEQQQQDIIIRNPGFPEPLAGGTELALLPGQVQRDPGMRMPYVGQATISVEQQLARLFLLRTTYTYQGGVHLLRGHNINAAQPGAGRPNPLAGNVIQVESAGRSALHSVSFNLGPAQNKLSRRLYWLLSYSFSDIKNDTDGPMSLPADNFDFRAERGPALGSARHRLFAMLNVQLFKALRLGTIIRANSATPYNITTGFDDNGDTVSNDRPRGIGRNSARGAAYWDVSTRLSWTTGFGTGRPQGPGERAAVTRVNDSADVLGALSPQATAKRWRMQLYLQAYNLFNHVNLVNFSGVQTSPFFGQATAAQPARRIEAGVKFSF